jgi:23S rRNA pseudouridine1911/1915/1917 synthase
MSEKITMLSHIVPPLQDGWSLRAVLLTGMGLSRKLLTRLKTVEHAILVDGHGRWMHEKMCVGEQIEVRLPVEQSNDILPQPLKLEILHEDEHLLLVNKPAGQIVHPTHGHYINTLANGVVHYWMEQGVRHRFRPIHRLDQDTSGVLAIAKNAYAHQYISEQFQKGQVSKTYIALVHGELSPQQGTIDAPIDRNPDEPHVRMVLTGGAASITHYEVSERLGVATLVRLRPITGRTHQLRVHMKHIGHPIVGDPLYGVTERIDPYCEIIQRQALHANKLTFIHPGLKESVTYEAPLPADMLQLVDAIRAYSDADQK